jgi:hypothetical protein
MTENDEVNWKNERFASALGISLDELNALDCELHKSVSKDGELYGYEIIFSPDSPGDMLDKIKNIDKNRLSFPINASSLETED